ncbi:MAG: tRNA (N(6)-L-threonylcarbamoyladenosine(37)-C(2))-methylthiotransferase MtaB, partial [Oscillospiraceae bacterium]|nr:tRNA (N(6)-L-threonylcarbamoyladenosine(37)-C(2))-methylthiotransferase MtaB [Oscillospiraceae bacterium]
MTVSFYTLGCKVNQYETQAMEQEMTRRGHTLVPFGEPADACVINTCSVTAEGDRKSRGAVRRARRECPSAVVAVCGCFPQVHADQAAELGADLVMGSADHGVFLDRLEALAAVPPADRAFLLDPGDPMKRRDFERLPAGGLADRTRALLKVEDGCVNFCSYCIIPYARGPVRSLPMDEARAQAVRLAEQGYRELVLTGIELSSWGSDLPGHPLPEQLILEICEAAPSLRVRLGSLEPRTITDSFCQYCAGLDNLCPHFHLSLQSGCDATLRRMNRKYDTARYLESVNLLRRYFPGCAVTTDLITGFPGETEEEFAETLDFLETCRFSAMHIFPYSPRPGTPAAELPDQVPRKEAEERARKASFLAWKMKRDYLERCTDSVLDVLFETGSRGYAQNYVEVRVDEEVPRNSLLPV